MYSIWPMVFSNTLASTKRYAVAAPVFNQHLRAACTSSVFTVHHLHQAAASPNSVYRLQIAFTGTTRAASDMHHASILFTFDIAMTAREAIQSTPTKYRRAQASCNRSGRYDIRTYGPDRAEARHRCTWGVEVNESTSRVPGKHYTYYTIK